ncbi:hypothetical protein WNB94_08430 [Aquabacterium sp. A3]|uniref:hypothetical protein n=1 Tax=Aquabacterium sp. A3 TaxID=3132829 RepID=UPI0031193803
MSTLITYWQSEASRILQAQAEARARLATLRQEGAVTRQALRTAQDQALTAAAEQERLRAALARVTMPADATPLLNDLSAARVAQAQALSDQAEAEGVLAQQAFDQDVLSRWLQALEADAAQVDVELAQAQAEATARTAFVNELQTGRWQEAANDATAALAAHETTAKARVEGAFPATDPAQPLLLQRLRDRAEAARDGTLRAQSRAQSAHAAAHPALAQAERAHAQALAAVREFADAATKVADDVDTLAALAALPAGRGPLTDAQAARLAFNGDAALLAQAEAALALLKAVDDAEDTVRSKQSAYDLAWAAARATTPDATLAALHAGAIKTPFDELTAAKLNRRNAHTALAAHADHPLLQRWLADVPDALWDALERLDAALARLKRLKDGTPLSQLLSALTLAESQHADALQAARLAVRQREAAQAAWSLLASRADVAQAEQGRRVRLAWRSTGLVN